VIRVTTLSTAGAKQCIDFAVRYQLQFVLFGTGWYGPERKATSDARVVQPTSGKQLDLHDVIRYGKKHGVGVILYVNMIALERDLDDLLPLYQQWGIAGIKFGFVRVGNEIWTRWLHEAILKAARYKLMVLVHDEYRMTGWQRTYPNLVSVEGIRGDEARPSTAEDLATLFSRMIVSPADHTFIYYAGYSKSTHAAQLAKPIIFFSPWQTIFWYDKPSDARDEPELEFFKQMPTTWDETRVLHGKIGQYAVIARRKQFNWFIGCLNAGTPRTLNLSLDFLGVRRAYQANIYFDDTNVRTRTHVGIDRKQVDSNTVVPIILRNPGAVAIRICDELTDITCF